MFTSKISVQRQADTHDVGTLTKRQKLIGICLFLFYLTMIAATIATLPYVSDVTGPIFERANDAF